MRQSSPWVQSSAGVGRLLGGFLRDSSGWGGSPGVWGLLGATPLQLLHQHLTAAPQGIPKLPEGAAAPQGAAAILRGGGWVRLCLTGYTAPWASQPLDSPRSTRRQAPPPRGQPQTEPPHPRAHLGCHGGLRARCHRPSGAPPPWSGVRGPGPEWVQGVSGEQGAPIRSHIGPRAPAHTPRACRPTCLRLRLAQSSSVCAASSLPWRRYRAPKLRRVVLTVGLRTGSRAVSDSVHPGIRAHPDTQPPLAPRSLWPTKMEPLWRAGPWLRST